ncbi:hypothetical protein [Amycolatopsis benzoatilytica]|uniref:hypothetical protein n=1 Tax=Amycolatopsis benzoatilytica TaxID=346045 RepID=UPI000369683C|nr:hypothetical protein [Amycolatopsis benzoatilytica]
MPTWPFAMVWGLVRLFKRDGPKRHAAIPSGPASGQEYRVAESLKQHSGEIAVVRGKTQLAIVELADPGAPPAVVWNGRGADRPQWSPSPASFPVRGGPGRRNRRRRGARARPGRPPPQGGTPR